MANTNGGSTTESDGPTSIAALVDEIRPLLFAAGIDEERQAAIIADISDDRDDAASRARVIRRYRAGAIRHGVRTAAVVAMLNRHRFLMLLADLEPLPSVYINAGARAHLLDALDEVANERDAAKKARGDAARDIAADGKGSGVKS
jgi:hypothetical protein